MYGKCRYINITYMEHLGYAWKDMFLIGTFVHVLPCLGGTDK